MTSPLCFPDSFAANARSWAKFALLGILVALLPAWDPFWSEDEEVARGNEHFLSQAPREAIDAYRATPNSRRPEVQYNIGLAALALAQSASSSAPATPPSAPQQPPAGGGQPAGTAPPPATPTDDLSQCLQGVRPACLRLAASSFAQATAAHGNSDLRANAFHSLGNVYLLQAVELDPPPLPEIPDLKDADCAAVQQALQSLEAPLAAFEAAAAPLGKAIDQYQSALLERPGDSDTAWNLALALRRRRDLEERRAKLDALYEELQRLAAEKCKDQQQNQQNQQNQNQQDQQNQDQQNQNQQDRQDQDRQDQQQSQEQQRQDEREQQQQEEQRRQDEGRQQDIQQQLQNLRDQEELFQQLRQREEALDEERQLQRLPFRPPRWHGPEKDW